MQPLQPAPTIGLKPIGLLAAPQLQATFQKITQKQNQATAGNFYKSVASLNKKQNHNIFQSYNNKKYQLALFNTEVRAADIGVRRN